MSSGSRDQDPLRYRILDEPRQGMLTRFAMPPIVPILAFMIVPILGVLLMIFNAVALCSNRMWQEIGYAVLGLLARAALPFLLGYGWGLGGEALNLAADQAVIWRGALDYLQLIPVVISFWCAYMVFRSQSIAYELKSIFDQSRRPLA